MEADRARTLPAQRKQLPPPPPPPPPCSREGERRESAGLCQSIRCFSLPPPPPSKISNKRGARSPDGREAFARPGWGGLEIATRRREALAGLEGLGNRSSGNKDVRGRRRRSGPVPSSPVPSAMKLLPGSLVVLLLLLASHAALIEAQLSARRRGQMPSLAEMDGWGRRSQQGQRWRSQFEDESPVDLESSGGDDLFEDDESDDVYSGFGSGSGYFEQESGVDTTVRLTTDVSVTLTATPVMLPVTSIQPVATPFETIPLEEATTERLTNSLYTDRVTEAPVVASRKVTTSATITAATAPETLPIKTARPTGFRRLFPPVTIAASRRSSTLEGTTGTVTEAAVVMEATTARHFSISTSQPKSLPRPATSRTLDITPFLEKSTIEATTATLAPTEILQTESWDVILATIVDNEVEIPVSGGPSGDSEIREEEDTTRPELGNEVVAVVTPAAGPGSGRNAETGLIDNTIDSGNSAAQLPQKNILERKEVLIAVIVGGVVGALFAAFLVMLLIYRMKKKDEGSYTLEEPKQASVTYQKPDKQEEFYA
ncbi:syndecan-3 isoform X1 [Rhinatrema bivittatum]|uniref:syndecan-3 isoform X1 n=1 Tax=Rhinatrema bivittatum TaxID=194408 RepID=UPI00112E1150|nr:syndecan-3 isoform X1 [Rhinatrema bivittatum]